MQTIMNAFVAVQDQILSPKKVTFFDGTGEEITSFVKRDLIEARSLVSRVQAENPSVSAIIKNN